MKCYSSSQLEEAIAGITNKLEFSIDSDLQQEYQNGMHPTLLSYEKVEKPSREIPAIQKYLIGAQTILNQPCQFYDIYRACRHFFFTQILNYALDVVIEKVANYEERFERLRREVLLDPFEALFYEFVVAARYAIVPSIFEVSFIEGYDRKLPEFEFLYNKEKIFVECKKFDRNADIVLQIRDDVRDKAQLTLDAFRAMNASTILEVSFHKDPMQIADSLIRDICIESFHSRNAIIDESLTAIAKPLDYKKLDEFTLFPSPKYYWTRYGYRTQDEWFGITQLMGAIFGRFENVVDPNNVFRSTWLDDVEFECALKWKITDPDIIWRYKRLGYSLLFKGLSQLQSMGENSVLHAWYERDSSIGHRQNELIDFFNRLAKNEKDIFSWIVFNETILDVSPEGNFDLIENAHNIRGPSGSSPDPLVSTVFTQDDDNQYEGGEFGVGYNLPDIDKII
jgi:hypothetical protein